MGYLEERANLGGKVAAVIGGGSGVGKAITLALANAGVDIAFCDVKEDSIAPTRAEVEKLGRRVTGRVTDAFDSEQLGAFYESFDHDFDRLDILVNIAGGGVFFRDFADATPEHWNGDILRNFEWVLQSMSRAIPRIRAGGRGGSVINFTTIEAHRGAARIAAYAGAKAGLTNFSRAVAVELAPEGIRVNLLAPDTTPSETSVNAVSKETLHESGFDDPELAAKSFAVYVPMGTAPPAEDLGDAVLFLASDLSSSVTGTTLHVDGGTSASFGFLNWPPPLGWMPAPPAIWFRDQTSS